MVRSDNVFVLSSPIGGSFGFSIALLVLYRLQSACRSGRQGQYNNNQEHSYPNQYIIL